MAIFIKTLRMRSVDTYTDYEQTILNFVNEGKQQVTTIVDYVQGLYNQLDGKATRSIRGEYEQIDTGSGNKPTSSDNQFPTGGALIDIHSSWDDALMSIRQFKELASKIKNGVLSVENAQVHEDFFDYAQNTIDFSVKGLCEEIAMYLVLTNGSTREGELKSRDWYDNLPGPLSTIGEVLEETVELPFNVIGLPIKWINQKCIEWSPDPLYPGKTIGDGLKSLHKGSSVASDANGVL